MILNPDPSFRELSDGSEGVFAPPVDIVEDEQAILVNVELAGVRPDDVIVAADHHVLTIRGERRADRQPPRESYHRRERVHGRFARSFRLPETVDTSDVVAVMVDGLLTVRLPKRPRPGATSAGVRDAS